MKKNYFKFLTLLTILCLGFSFNSCSSDDDDEKDDFKSLIVGKWKMHEATPSEDFEPCDFNGYIYFNEDGTYSEFDYCTNSTLNGTWSIEGRNITAVLSSFPIPVAFKIISIDASNMTLEYTSVLSPKITAKYKLIN